MGCIVSRPNRLLQRLTTMSLINKIITQCHFRNCHFFCRFYFADTTEVKNYLLWHNLTGKIMAFIFQLIKHETKHEYFNLDVAQWVEIHSAAIFLYFEHGNFYEMFLTCLGLNLSCSLNNISHHKFWSAISKEPFGVSLVCLLVISYPQNNFWTNQKKVKLNPIQDSEFIKLKRYYW